MKKLLFIILSLGVFTPLFGQVYDNDYLEYRRRTTVSEDIIVNDTLTYKIATGAYRVNIENLTNTLFYQPNSEINGADIEPDKEYDMGIFSWDGFEKAVEESFTTKERYELWKSGEELIVKYIFSGDSGVLLELAFRIKKGGLISSFPLEKIALLEHNLKKYWRMQISKSADYQLRYISDACVYFFPKVLYIDPEPQTKVEGLEVFAPKE